MPLLINRSAQDDPGGSPKRASKQKAKKPDKPSVFDDTRVQISLLIVVIIGALAFLGWWLGWFGKRGPTPVDPNAAPATSFRPVAPRSTSPAGPGMGTAAPTGPMAPGASAPAEREGADSDETPGIR